MRARERKRENERNPDLESHQTLETTNNLFIFINHTLICSIAYFYTEHEEHCNVEFSYKNICRTICAHRRTNAHIKKQIWCADKSLPMRASIEISNYYNWYPNLRKTRGDWQQRKEWGREIKWHTNEFAHHSDSNFYYYGVCQLFHSIQPYNTHINEHTHAQ